MREPCLDENCKIVGLEFNVGSESCQWARVCSREQKLAMCMTSRETRSATLLIGLPIGKNVSNYLKH